MQTDDLIADLSARLEPIKRGAMTRMVLTGLACGILAAALLMLSMLGLRHDFSAAIVTFGMWTKLAYTFALAALGFLLVERAGRPGAELTRPALLLLLPVLAILLLSALQMTAPGADRHVLMMGHSARVCPFIIVMVSLPILGATFWALRRMAPTRLGLAGAGAGLFAGAAGAFVYAFYCTESAAPFVALWYSLGIGLVGFLGFLLGPRTLRW